MIGSIGTSSIGTQATRSSVATAGASEEGDFLALAEGTAAKPKAAKPIKPAARPATTDRTTADSSAKLKDALAAFKKEASLTPAERARRDVLETMDLTEEAIEAMSPEQRKATEEKIAMEVARRMRAAKAAG